ncbi:MAG: xanthine dehydrogenase family protein molybdopterin-binding subunit [Firmicutes bacterium]|nr:xanthine dehydrogenase family protein molybdopterin-binding subunit [Alicyclobacillaceae bacterium]MCL6498244.1 xanthine dehydrogenase family protein molybdopterin-binding subunit [Bacillota bacterium]
MARIDAPAKVAGTMAFTADVRRPGLCYAAVVRSPYPHARIRLIDAASARRLDGVVAVVTGRDLPDRTYGRAVRDIPALAKEEVRYVGERVVAVVAETRAAAERAASRVRIEYDPQPAVLDPESALADDAPRVHAQAWAYPGAVVGPDDPPNLQSRVHLTFGGSVEEGLQKAAAIVDAVYTTPAGQHGYLEPQACLAEIDREGRMHLWIPNKSPYRLREQLAAYFDVDPALIEIHPVAIGGDFGGKGSPMDAPLCLELARLVGRPVLLQLRYNEDLTATESRHAGRIRVRVGADVQGRLTALAVDALFNGGAYAGYKPAKTAELLGVREAGGAYRIPALELTARIAYTHTLPGGHMRSPGSPQVVFAVESALDELAAALGIDPVELRRRNLLTTGEVDAHGIQAVEHRGHKTLEAALAALRPRPVPAGWRYGRGIAIYNRATFPGSTSLRLTREADGRVTVVIPLPETGTGSHTVVQRTVAQALGIPEASVTVVQGSTRELPYDDGVGGSRVTAAIGVAVAQALEAWAAQGHTGTVEVVVRPEGVPRVTSYCVEVAQVAVDPETGQVAVLELLAAVDVAQIVNPLAHQIQLEGGLAMGYGFSVMEDLAVREGQVTAATLGDFKIPSAQDVPPLQVVLVPGGQGLGFGNTKGVGELTNVPTAAAIANAVAQAVGVRIRDLPISAERVYQHLVRVPSAGPKEVAL